MGTKAISLNAIAYREGGAWIIQGIEYDIVAFANDVSELPLAFAQAVAENACITEHLGRAPLEGIKPAPDRFREMFASASVEMKATHPPQGAEIAVRLAGPIAA